MRCSSTANNHGAALVEVLIAVGLLVVFCAGTAQVITGTAITMKVMRAETYAVVLAEDKLEEVVAAAALGVSVEVSPLDALERDCAGFVEYLDEQGQPVREATPERGAVYVRRGVFAHFQATKVERSFGCASLTQQRAPGHTDPKQRRHT